MFGYSDNCGLPCPSGVDELGLDVKTSADTFLRSYAEVVDGDVVRIEAAVGLLQRAEVPFDEESEDEAQSGDEPQGPPVARASSAAQPSPPPQLDVQPTAQDMAANIGDRWADLSISEGPKWRFKSRATDQLVGLFHQMSLRSLKATCKMHPRCVCWLSGVTDVFATERDLVEWLAAASTTTAVAHLASATLLKRRYGMRVRS